MRRSERHHLRENAVAVAIGNLQEWFHEWGRWLTIVGAIVLGGLVLLGGYSLWSERNVARAGTLLANALVLADAPVVPPPPPPAAELAEAAPDGVTEDTAEPAEAAPDATEDTAEPTETPAPIEFVFIPTSIFCDPVPMALIPMSPVPCESSQPSTTFSFPCSGDSFLRDASSKLCLSRAGRACNLGRGSSRSRPGSGRRPKK